jgi:hypothetical protein
MALLSGLLVEIHGAFMLAVHVAQDRIAFLYE